MVHSVMLIQEVVTGTISIWPQNVLGWLQLAAALLVVMGGTLGLAWKMVEKRFHHLDENKLSRSDFKVYVDAFKKAETQVHKSEARLESVEYKLQGFEYKHEQVSREVSMVNESVKSLEKLFRAQQEQTGKDISRMTEAVVRLEGAVLGVPRGKRRQQEE